MGITKSILLSVVLDVDTSHITGDCSLKSQINIWVNEIEAAFENKYELILCSSLWSKKAKEEINCILNNKEFYIIDSETGYYGLKNKGASKAKGEIVFFGDADCRPSTGYFNILKKNFQEKQLKSIAGVTLYDGKNILTRINSTFSFGYLHQGKLKPEPYSAMAHNIAILNSCMEDKPFGDHEGRTGGDRYITNRMTEMGHFELVNDLIIYHEDPTFSLRGKLDRHLIEHFNHLSNVNKLNKKILFQALLRVFKSPKKRLLKLNKYGSSMGIKWFHHFPALAMITVYFIIDFVAVSAILSVKPWRSKWIKYQYGNRFS